VELSSGSGLYWASADLFVADHPYFALTDAKGYFAIEGVPSGKLEVVAWLPGWKPAKTERDADSTQVARQKYSAPVERTTVVEITASRLTEVNLTLP
jgi:hypothetical protein